MSWRILSPEGHLLVPAFVVGYVPFLARVLQLLEVEGDALGITSVFPFLGCWELLGQGHVPVLRHVREGARDHRHCGERPGLVTLGGSGRGAFLSGPGSGGGIC